MKTIGLIGGITWYSTMDYYKLMNEMVNARLGGVSSAKVLTWSVNFAEIKELTEKHDWDGIASILCDVARALEKAGADSIMLGANTMHNIAERVEAVINVPLIHIADAVARKIKAKALHKVALLGTKYTMQMDFYRDRLIRHGIDVVIPGEKEIEFINNCIYNEFGKGIFLPERKSEFLSIIDVLTARGAQGVILGCTEIPILIKQEDCEIPVFDTAFIHAEAAVDFAMA